MPTMAWEIRKQVAKLNCQHPIQTWVTISSGRTGVNEGMGYGKIPRKSLMDSWALKSIRDLSGRLPALADYKETKQGPLLTVVARWGRQISKTSHQLYWTFLEMHFCLMLSLPTNFPSFPPSFKGSDEWSDTSFPFPLTGLLQVWPELAIGALRSQGNITECMPRLPPSSPAKAHGSPARMRPSVVKYFWRNWKSMFLYQIQDF